MPTYLRGLPGVRDVIVKRRNQLAAQLVADDKLMERGSRGMGKVERASLQGGILEYNYLLETTFNPNVTHILSEAEYDQFAVRFTSPNRSLCASCVDRVIDGPDGYCSVCRREATAEMPDTPENKFWKDEMLGVEALALPATENTEIRAREEH